MGLDYILRKVSSEAGMMDYATNANTRTFLVDIINEAAKELYEQTDLPGSLREVYVRAYSEEELALPQFVGQVRAIRENTEPHVAWHMYGLRPRYHNKDWPTKWKSWIVKGPSPIQMDVNNSAPPIASIPVADNTVSVTIVGATAQSSRIAETVTMSATEVSFTSLFVTFDSITKNIVSNHDITILDIEDAELAVIPNDCLESRYLIVDISKYPFLERATSEGRVMEVLYKDRLRPMINDTDIFPIPEYDEMIILKAKQLINEDREGNEQRVLLMDRKLDRALSRKKEDAEGGRTRRINFGQNPYYDLYKPWRFPL